MFEVVYNFTFPESQPTKNVPCGVFDTFEAAKEYILEQFDRLVEDTTDWETGKGMVEDESWYENFILDKYEIREVEVTVN
jgi:hypothetical protein